MSRASTSLDVIGWGCLVVIAAALVAYGFRSYYGPEPYCQPTGQTKSNLQQMKCKDQTYKWQAK
jgi:hypothetical protein